MLRHLLAIGAVSAALTLSVAALAAEGGRACTEVKTRFADSVGIDQKGRITHKGYERVQIILQKRVADDADPEQEAMNAAFLFRIHAASARLRLNKTYDLVRAGQCHRTVRMADGSERRVDETILKVRATVAGTGESWFALKTAIILPSDLVASLPVADTILSDGVEYVGRWSNDGAQKMLTFTPNE